MKTLSHLTTALVSLSLLNPGYAGETQPYTTIDRHALKAPRRAETSLAKLAEYLAGPCRTDRDKVRAAYRWVTDRVAYDREAFASGKYGDTSAAAVLKTRKTVCEGYADLFAALCRRMGAKVVKVSGYARIDGYKPGDKFTETNHTWNAVYLDGKWYLVDATWGAGWSKGRRFEKHFSEFMFLADPEALSFSHLPKESKWQLVKRPLTLAQFERLPEVNRLLFEKGVSPARIRTAMSAKNFREFVVPLPTPGFSATLLDVPLNKFLKAGKQYRFEIRSRECLDMLIFNEGKHTPLEKDGDVFRVVLTAQKGQLSVGGTVGEMDKNKQKQYWFLLSYVVE
jgi:hypothetical protein